MLIWHDAAWAEYLDWHMRDKKTLKRINALIKDIVRHPFDGIGNPEQLKGNLAGCWSRRIDDCNRLIYRIVDGNVQLAQCKGHYDG